MRLEIFLHGRIDNAIGIIEGDCLDMSVVGLGIVKKSVSDLIEHLALIDDVENEDIILFC